MIHWYVIRASGAVTLILFSLTVVMGLLNGARLSSDGWPRFVIRRLHRNVSLLAVVFLCLHVVTVVTDSFVSVDLMDVVVPLHSSYRTFWVALGAIALDLLLALVITSLLKRQIGTKLWRGVHWLAYIAWPIAVAHGIGIGTDSGRTWMLAIDVVCIGSVLTALAMRLPTPARRGQPALRAARPTKANPGAAG